MQNVVLSLLVNGMMAALLLITIVYCWRLNSRIRILQDSKSELARIIREFDESTQRATDSIAEIHEATSRLSENIQHKIDKANFIATDLDMIIEKGNRLAGRAPDTGSTQRPARTQESPVNRPPRESAMAAVQGNVSGVTPLASAEPPPARGPRANRPRSRAEQELMNVLKANDESGR